ncbi:expressed unknown protein [Seminavis robusta]|uniref:Uncharacterized protein n=1 Tax=Seminavis robusta TaxID=568900 RepID=A0A9N8HNV3_9STRA|nr:expressed unknown protein [Seminavis robusta]|eukprot:Sro852_g211020.1 n/a (112) ;mRNA; f:24887-25222
MKAWFYVVLILALTSRAVAFTAKKLDPRSSRPAFKSTASVGKDRDDVSQLPVHGNTPAFALPQGTSLGVSMSPAVYNGDEDEDEDELFSYGTALVSCVISLALGFTLGYGT